VVSAPARHAPQLTALTPHEQAIVEQLARGATYAQIAARRKRSRRTVANQVSSVLRKLEVGSSRELLLLIHRVSG